MDARQMVALRKALGAAPDAGSGEGPESADEMAVQCPKCGCEFVPEPEQPPADLPVDA